jgi:peptide methionine sulfoxide reductase MsrB
LIVVRLEVHRTRCGRCDGHVFEWHNPYPRFTLAKIGLLRVNGW